MQHNATNFGKSHESGSMIKILQRSAMMRETFQLEHSNSSDLQLWYHEQS